MNQGVTWIKEDILVLGKYIKKLESEKWATETYAGQVF